MSNNTFLHTLKEGIPSKLPPLLPRNDTIPHAPFRNSKLSMEEKKVKQIVLNN